jgi:hypothetical protein
MVMGAPQDWAECVTTGATETGREPRNDEDRESDDATEKVAKSTAMTRMLIN